MREQGREEEEKFPIDVWGKKIEGKIWAAKPQKEAILSHFPDNTGILICAYI